MRTPVPISINIRTRHIPPRPHVLFNSRAFKGTFAGWMCKIKFVNEFES